MKINSFFLVLFTLVCFSCDSEKSTTSDKAEQIKSVHPKVDQLTAEIAKSPSNPNLYAARGDAWYNIKGFDEAILDYQKAISLDESQPQYHHSLANVYMDYFRSRNALKVMENAGILFPERIPTLLKLSELQLILKEHPAALRTLDRIAKISPLNSEMSYMRGLVYKDMGKTKEAISALRFATENNSEFVEAYLELGDLTAETDKKMSLQFYDNALRVDPKNIDALAHKAYHLSNVMDNIPAALEVYKEINVLAPQYDEGFYNSGLLYMELDSLDQAYRQFTYAIKASPLHIMSYYYRGVASEKKEDFVQAKEDYEQVTKMAPSYVPGKDGYKRMIELVGS